MCTSSAMITSLVLVLLGPIQGNIKSSSITVFGWILLLLAGSCHLHWHWHPTPARDSRQRQPEAAVAVTRRPRRAGLAFEFAVCQCAVCLWFR